MKNLCVSWLVVVLFLFACTESVTQPYTGPIALSIVSGEGQSGPPGVELPDPLVVKVEDARGRRVRGQIVNFRVIDGDGSVFAGVAETDRRGIAQERWTLGLRGAQRVEARAVNTRTGEALTFAEFTATVIGEIPPTAPPHLAFSVQPTNTVLNQAILPAVQVEVRDGVGALVTASTAVVTLFIGTNPSGGVLSGTNTVNAIGGIATFSGLSINQLGEGYTLLASSGALTAATSDEFRIEEPQEIIQLEQGGNNFSIAPFFAVGQTFTPLDGSFDSFSFWLQGEVGNEFEVFLYEWDSGVAAMTGSELWSSGARTATPGVNSEVVFTPGLVLDPGLEYLLFVYQSAFPQVSVLSSFGNPYAGGQLVRAEFPTGTSPASAFTRPNIAASESSHGNLSDEDMTFTALFSVVR